MESESIKISKRICILSNKTVCGSIFYTRPFTNEYMIKNVDIHSTETGNNSEHQKQGQNPVDYIDEIILNAIKKIYPNTVFKQHNTVFNEVYKNMPRVGGKIRFWPKQQDFEELKTMNSNLYALEMDLTFYISGKPTDITDSIFFANYDLNRGNIFEILKSVKFQYDSIPQPTSI